MSKTAPDRSKVESSVIYKKRALPLVWVVVQGSKGHFPEETYVHLVQAVNPCIPDGADVIFLGDGEFDGVGLQAEIDQESVLSYQLFGRGFATLCIYPSRTLHPGV